MNEPSNFATNGDPSEYPAGHPRIEVLRCPTSGDDSKLEMPPYLTASAYQHGETLLSAKSLCMLGVTVGGSNTLYNTHSLYGWAEAVATEVAQRAINGNKRGAVISRFALI